MHDFVRQVIQLRKDHGYALAPKEYGAGAPFTWKSAANTDQVDWNSRHLMIHYYDASAGPELAILINMQREAVEFTLPEGRTWRRLLDTQRWFDQDDDNNDADFFDSGAADPLVSHNINLEATEDMGATYLAQDSSIVVLEAAP